MRDYWLTKELLQAAGIGFLLLALIGIGLALWLPKKWWGKLLAVLAVGFVTAIPIYKAVQDNHQQQVVVDDYKERLAKAQALFEERCKTAGEKIYKTVDDVDGVLLIKVRPDKINFAEQRVMDDPYGQENSGGDGYIRSFLAGKSDAYWLTDKTIKGAFQFVEVIDTSSQNITRYTAEITTKSGTERLSLRSNVESRQEARYAVDWQDESTPTDRDNWIACGSVMVLDSTNKEILGKRTGCMLDTGLGDTSGGRSPWAYARDSACPAPRKTPDGRAIFDPIDRNFVEKVLRPNTKN